jgi:hypothetical protein
MNINKETFEAWLFSQPDDRTFDYMDNRDCLVCKYVKEVVGYKKNFSVGADYIRLHESLFTEFTFEKWFIDLLGERYNFSKHSEVSIFTFGEMKEAWLELWPDTENDLGHGRRRLTQNNLCGN